MSSHKMNNKHGVERPIKKSKSVEEGYLDIIENTLKTFKEQKKEDIHHLNDIEYHLEHYKKEIEHMTQRNNEMYDLVLKLIKNKKTLDNKVKKDIKRTDKHIQLIQIQREI